MALLLRLLQFFYFQCLCLRLLLFLFRKNLLAIPALLPELFCLGTEGESANLVIVIGRAARDTDGGIFISPLALLVAAEVVLAMMEFLMFGCVAMSGCMYDLYCRVLIRVIRLIFDDGLEKESECRGNSIPGYAPSMVIGN